MTNNRFPPRLTFRRALSSTSQILRSRQSWRLDTLIPQPPKEVRPRSRLRMWNIFKCLCRVIKYSRHFLSNRLVVFVSFSDLGRAVRQCRGEPVRTINFSFCRPDHSERLLEPQKLLESIMPASTMTDQTHNCKLCPK